MGGLLTGETEAEFGYLSFGRVRFRPVDPDIRACIGTNVARPAHLKFTLAPAAFVEMAVSAPRFSTMSNNQAPTRCPFVERRGVAGGSARATREADWRCCRAG